MRVIHSRVDERLIHGQIINAWCAKLKPTCLIIIDEELVENDFMATVFRALAPLWLETIVLSPDSTVDYLTENKKKDGSAFLLSRTPVQFAKLMKKGVDFETVTLTGKIYNQSKGTIPKEYKSAVQALMAAGVKVVIQELPSDEPTEVYIEE